jgi:hypothetical protein
MADRSRAVKLHLISPNAHGRSPGYWSRLHVVRSPSLSNSIGHGHTARYLEPGRVTKSIALEPDTACASTLTLDCERCWFSRSERHPADSFIWCPRHKPRSFPRSGVAMSVDTRVYFYSLYYSISTPDNIILYTWCIEAWGIQLHEHVLSHRSDVAWWQKFWTPFWRMIVDGCRLDRPTHLWL